MKIIVSLSTAEKPENSSSPSLRKLTDDATTALTRIVNNPKKPAADLDIIAKHLTAIADAISRHKTGQSLLAREAANGNSKPSKNKSLFSYNLYSSNSILSHLPVGLQKPLEKYLISNVWYPGQFNMLCWKHAKQLSKD